MRIGIKESKRAPTEVKVYVAQPAFYRFMRSRGFSSLTVSENNGELFVEHGKMVAPLDSVVLPLLNEFLNEMSAERPNDNVMVQLIDSGSIARFGFIAWRYASPTVAPYQVLRFTHQPDKFEGLSLDEAMQMMTADFGGNVKMIIERSEVGA